MHLGVQVFESVPGRVIAWKLQHEGGLRVGVEFGSIQLLLDPFDALFPDAPHWRARTGSVRTAGLLLAELEPATCDLEVGIAEETSASRPRGAGASRRPYIEGRSFGASLQAGPDAPTLVPAVLCVIGADG